MHRGLPGGATLRHLVAASVAAFGIVALTASSAAAADLKDKAASVGEKVKEAAVQTKDKLKEAAVETKDTIKEKTVDAKDSVKAKLNRSERRASDRASVMSR